MKKTYLAAAASVAIVVGVGWPVYVNTLKDRGSLGLNDGENHVWEPLPPPPNPSPVTDNKAAAESFQTSNRKTEVDLSVTQTPAPKTATDEAKGKPNSSFGTADRGLLAERERVLPAKQRPKRETEASRQALPSAPSPIPLAKPVEMGRPALESSSGFLAGSQQRAEERSGDQPPPQSQADAPGRDQFDGQLVSPQKVVRQEPVSTFSLDVDTASYSFVRASLTRNVLPPKAAVRTEELVNYFPYAYPASDDPKTPFRTTVSVFPSPWTEGRSIIHVGIKGYAVKPAERPKANLVFLVDTSGSMSSPNRLPLAKQALAMLIEQLTPEDRVAIVAYADSAGTVLEPTPVAEKAKILSALERLGAGGSTAGAEGIRLAYSLAERSFDPKGVNRVMLLTDGDFNVGITSRDELKGFVERKREKGVYLSVLGFGMGNYNDAMMQALAQNGNGVAAYIDTLSEARKVLVEEATSSIVPIAKDVKVQVEFNPRVVSEYRLVGYETRALRREDFANDKVDAGDVGSGLTVTAIYEIVPVGGPRAIADLRYGEASLQPSNPQTVADLAQEVGYLSIRYKLPHSDTSELMSTAIAAGDANKRFEDASPEARFAVSVAGFAELLRGGTTTGRLTFDDVIRTASAAKGEDPFGYRSEFIQLVRAAKTASALRSNQP